MGKINVLDFKVANLIAAGEVVDRPASALKEILENSIDSGADNITVELKRGGVSFMRVSDNGCGMSREDVCVCIKRHATSKIKNACDLDGISTLGFRGEALAAISSVSKLRIMTKRSEDETGTAMTSISGEVVSVEDIGAQNGTTVIVEELFANVPARRKFLKRDASEGMACAAIVEKIVLSHPEVSIRFITDGQLRYVTDGKNDLYTAIYAVLGKDFAQKLIRVESVMEGIKVYGFIGEPSNTRSNRNYQNFFINGRYVKSKTAMAAIEQAYSSFIPSEKFPVCVLSVTIHPSFVDVNVHPTKLEVKFSDDKKFFDAVYCAVRNELEQSIKRPELKIEPTSVSYDELKVKNAFTPIYDRTDITLGRKNEQVDFFEPPKQSAKMPEPDIHTEKPHILDYGMEKGASKFGGNGNENIIPVIEKLKKLSESSAVNSSISIPQNTEKDEPEIPFYKIIGEAFNSYVIVELEGKILLIDKHAAHERIIFELMKRNMQKSEASTQMLLLPTEIKFEPGEYSAVSEYEEKIKSMGYEYQRDDRSFSVSVNGIPSVLEESEAYEMFSVLAEQLSSGEGNADITKELFMEKALYQASCKAAIKAGRIEDAAHIKWICDNLLAYCDIKVCPHGRPVAIELDKNEMEKQFKRK